ncbi:subtilase family serine protease [Kitasatospora sp. MAP12-15]|uniref:S53 family peptidase n=1 Tax=unclassified Kitasatospora TaxID=2633591 RepID=UPI00247673D9|nr:S53 family peptidase [Kitasatospora sp. MAP12-44]MDH6108883.1 subtilase family serine protease [Kitasatospora sp. MAP12-44]
MPLRRLLVLPAAAALIGSALSLAAAPTASATRSGAAPRVSSTAAAPTIRTAARLRHTASTGDPVLPAPLPTSTCLTQLQRACYSPLQYRTAYDLNPLYSAGITGKGRTIVIVDSYGSPTIQHDLDVYDAQYGLPGTQVQVVKWGQVPAFDPTNADMDGWAGETTLDVEAAHAVAPGANIVLLETGVSETEGPVGIPEMMSGINHLVNAGQADVVSMSWATSEAEFPGFDVGDYTSLTTLRYAFTNAAQHGVTLTASSGDGGGDSTKLDAAWPAGDPLVTAVGGTELQLNDQGQRTAPDTAWSGSGGERSKVFARPGYQDVVRSVVGDQRGTPDVSMAGSPNGALWLYSSFDPANTGWTADGAGTSESSPLFAAVVALADQAAGHRLGQIDNDLYRLYAQHSAGIVDVTTGSTGTGGYTAGPGYDQATGVGTVDAGKLVRTLAHQH